ncbi:Transcriptional regulator, MarR family [Lutibaculum baratangense AMV1]|uniref:Transcriptional regulator, MarR family n=1 Tax=Lutibaculum baratangense AMV1 TaxID=631454 RepID=V4RB97_9HYPH|nr:Transcriptional regulator, MarR family [Lutibaculum baratangense AMV1]
MSTVAEQEDEEILVNRVWFNLFRTYRHLSPKIEKRLKAAGVGHPIWYELLIQVERAGDRGINLVTLQHQLFLPQYALSRQAGFTCFPPSRDLWPIAEAKLRPGSFRGSTQPATGGTPGPTPGGPLTFR